MMRCFTNLFKCYRQILMTYFIQEIYIVEKPMMYGDILSLLLIKQRVEET